MAWPASPPNTDKDNFDAQTDTAQRARVQFVAMQDNLKLILDSRGIASGVCDLDDNSLVPIERLPTGSIVVPNTNDYWYGRVTNSGAPALLPDGWSVSLAANVYTVTHTLFTPNFHVFLTGHTNTVTGSQGTAVVGTIGVGSFTIEVYDQNDAKNSNSAVSFLVIEY